MQNGNSNADSAVPNNPQQLLYYAYQQLHQAVVGRQQLITSYHDLVIKHETQVSALNVKHEAQVSALKDQIDMLKGQIDTLKDEVRTARADAETSQLSNTRYIISYPSTKHLLMFYEAFTIAISSGISRYPCAQRFGIIYELRFSSRS